MEKSVPDFIPFFETGGWSGFSECVWDAVFGAGGALRGTSVSSGQ